MRVFKGWIPTITGNLSFSTIGTGQNPPKLFQKFHAFDGVHYTVAAQKRRTSDSLFGRLGDWLDRRGDRQGYTVFVLFGASQKANGHSVISGPCIEVSHSTYLKNEQYLKDLTFKNDIDAFEKSFLQALEKFKSASCEPSGVISAVEVHRSGQATIEIDDELYTDAADQKMLASQVYFFLRDICHVHQHHADSSDTISDVTDCTKEDDAWKRETLYSLYRWVIQQKRAKRVEAYFSAKGVLSYAHTFQKTHPIKDKNFDRDYFREATVESIEAGLEKATYEEATKRKFTETLLIRTLPLLALAFALLTPLYTAPTGVDLTREQVLLAEFSGWFNRHVISVFASVLAVSLIYTLAVTYFRRLYNRKCVLDLMRMALVLPRKLVLIICLVLASTALVMAFILFQSYYLPNLPTEFVANKSVQPFVIQGPF